MKNNKNIKYIIAIILILINIINIINVIIPWKNETSIKEVYMKSNNIFIEMMILVIILQIINIIILSIITFKSIKKKKILIGISILIFIATFFIPIKFEKDIINQKYHQGSTSFNYFDDFDHIVSSYDKEYVNVYGVTIFEKRIENEKDYSVMIQY